MGVARQPVYIYVCICVSVSVCANVGISPCLFVCRYIYMCVYIYVGMGVRVCVQPGSMLSETGAIILRQNDIFCRPASYGWACQLLTVLQFAVLPLFKGIQLTGRRASELSAWSVLNSLILEVYQGFVGARIQQKNDPNVFDESLMSRMLFSIDKS